MSEERSSFYHFRARAYDPAQGRFAQRDPLGIWNDGLGNAYSYAEVDPVNQIDPLGLRAGDPRPPAEEVPKPGPTEDGGGLSDWLQEGFEGAKKRVKEAGDLFEDVFVLVDDLIAEGEEFCRETDEYVMATYGSWYIWALVHLPWSLGGGAEPEPNLQRFDLWGTGFAAYALVGFGFGIEQIEFETPHGQVDVTYLYVESGVGLGGKAGGASYGEVVFEDFENRYDYTQGFSNLAAGYFGGGSVSWSDDGDKVHAEQATLSTGFGVKGTKQFYWLINIHPEEGSEWLKEIEK